MSVTERAGEMVCSNNVLVFLNDKVANVVNKYFVLVKINNENN